MKVATDHRGKPQTFQRPPRTGLMVATAVEAWLLLTATVYAHRIVLFAWIEGDTVYTEGKFPGGGAVKHGDITVFNEADRELLKGRTDDQGLFSFSLKSLPSPTGLKIVLNAGMGHQAHWELSRQEIGRAMGMAPDTGRSPLVSENAADEPAASPDTSPAETKEAVSGCISEAELKKIVEDAVDRKLSPVMSMLISIREEAAVGLDDIFAGLGYILGLTGVAALFYARKKRR